MWDKQTAFIHIVSGETVLFFCISWFFYPWPFQQF
uniref:Uncharacterized protein n=1 Tax=Anguilla anguilla TaxID=7936 RepID=A0A0E9S6D1_ANGAN